MSKDSGLDAKYAVDAGDHRKPSHKQELRISASQRAAVIVALLGEAAAKPIVSKLEDQEVLSIARSLSSISFLTRHDLEEIAIDFLTHLRNSSGALRGGEAEARRILSEFIDGDKLDEMLAGNGITRNGELQETDVWTRLKEAPAASVASYLSRVNPNLAAVVLSKLETERASDILGLVNEDDLPRIVGGMVDQDSIDPGVEVAVGRMVEIELLNVASRADAEEEPALEAVGEIVSLLPSARRSRVIEYLDQNHSSDLETIKRSMLTVDRLAERLPKKAVPVVFREVGPTAMVRLLASLNKGHPQIAEQLLGGVSSRMADQFRADILALGPLSDDEIEASQRDFISKIMSLSKSGAIVLD